MIVEASLRANLKEFLCARNMPSFILELKLLVYLTRFFFRLLELTEDSIKSFVKAIEILRITHGTRTPFMKELLNKLEEARAEASHKHSFSD